MAIGRKSQPEQKLPVTAVALPASGPHPERPPDRSTHPHSLVPGAHGGGPLDLHMDLIDEDPHQPRTKDNPGFSDARLDELAASIILRGVKTPISVRENPHAPGRYLINHGARRFRGSRRAEKTTIPGFIDNDYNEADQVVENLQRNELTPREIADYIGRELAKGLKKIDVARVISKSPAFVTQHVTLLDLPDPIAAVFHAGRCKDVTVINELVTAFKMQPQEVRSWLEDASVDITRGAVRLLREFLDAKRQHEHNHEDGNEGDDARDYGVDATLPTVVTKREQSNAAKLLKKAIVEVRHQGRCARLILNRRPGTPGRAWLRYEDDGQTGEVSLEEVQLVALREG